MPWLAGAVVLAVFFGTIAAARALKASPYNVAGGLVMVTAAFTWVVLILPDGLGLPRAFQEPLLTYSSLAGVVACLFAFTRRLIWPIFPLYFCGKLLLFMVAWNGMPRMF